MASIANLKAFVSSELKNLSKVRKTNIEQRKKQVPSHQHVAVRRTSIAVRPTTLCHPEKALQGKRQRREGHTA
ncbi:unnamed protein product [Callosobruchus maculatus]|uniref:Uncharacterized protein n=1 Tax=Callosobruchus maculatus TaxID=64391 RepID=A0A653C9H3_CALMS|nr:unnamed protein product [Callosobruchus maculatus]